MASDKFQLRWDDEPESRQEEEDLERIPRPLWHSLLDLGLVVFTVAAEIAVARIWPHLVIVNVVSYFVIAFVVLMGIALLLDRFFPEGLRAYLFLFLIIEFLTPLFLFLIIEFLTPRGRPGLTMRSMKHLTVMSPRAFTLTVATLCFSSIPIAFFTTVHKLLFLIGSLTVVTTAVVIVSIRIMRRQYAEQKALEDKERREQEQREELGRWK